MYIMNIIVLFRTGQAAANFSTPSDSIAGVGRTFKYKQNQIGYFFAFPNSISEGISTSKHVLRKVL